MTEIVFYDGPTQAMLPMLLEKGLAQGWRAVVRVREDEALTQLDRLLWTYRDDSFLPHSCARLGSEANQPIWLDQPIWLTIEAENPNKAEMLVLLDDAEAFALESFKRCLYLFDGHNEEAMTRAQKRQDDFKDYPITFWRQSASGWVKDEFKK